METNAITLNHEIEELKRIKENLLTEVIELDDKILFQDFGVYEPQFSFSSSDEYKKRLNEIREEQKLLIKRGLAAKCYKNWKVNGSEKEGKKLISESIKLIIRNFNIECDICIDKVKFSNYTNSENRILKSFEMQNKLNETNEVEITHEYLSSKMKELALAYEYQKKRKQEKEELRILKEQQREEEKVAREIEAKRLELEKEQAHYQNVLKRVNEQIEVEESEERRNFLIEKKEELNNNLADVDKAMEDLDYREANHRAGYVYIISNIGAFGPDIYKIGMTRRLEPEDRISELSGASVPFRFDVHAMIFSNDAPKLEAALHNAFADKKVNLVNGRKEFFRVTLDEIKKVVRENHDKTVEFISLPDAEQFRESEMIRKRYTSTQ
jgi:hypothetical protein